MSRKILKDGVIKVVDRTDINCLEIEGVTFTYEFFKIIGCDTATFHSQYHLVVKNIQLMVMEKKTD